MARVLPSEKKGLSPQAATAQPWITVVLVVVLLFIVNANNSTFGIFFKPIAEQFDWSRGAVSIAISIRWVAVAFLVMPIGRLSDRYGPRKVILPSCLLLALGFLLTSRITAVWHLYLVQGMIMGAGTAGPFVCLMTTVARWNNRRRGLALGIASTGSGLAVVFLPPLVASLIAVRGWGQASIALGLLTLVIAVPASMFMKEPPLETSPRDEVAVDKRKGPFDVMLSLPHLLRDRQFLSLLMLFFFFYIGWQLVSNHLVNYVTDAGIGTLVAATMMSVAGIASIMGRLALGPISDKIGTRADAVVSYSLAVTALVLLMFKVESLMWVSAVLFGVGSGGAVPLIPAFAADYFGTKSLATMTGALMIGINLGAAIGPWMGGFLFDLTGGYLWALVLSAVLAAAGVVIALRLGPPTRGAG